MFKNNFSSLSEDAIRQIYDANPLCSLIVKADSGEYPVIFANNALKKATQKEYAEIVGFSIFDVFPGNAAGKDPKSDHPGRKILDSVVLTKQSFTLSDYRCDARIPGTNTFVETYWTTTHSPIFDEADNVDMILLSSVDVTEKNLLVKREVENVVATKFQLEQIHSLLMQAPLAIVVLKGRDLNSYIINEAFCVFTGTTRENLLGKPLFQALPHIGGFGYEELIGSVLEKGETQVARGSMVPLNRNGRLENVYFNFVFSPYRDEMNAIIGVFCIGLDVTEEVTSKIRLEESEAKFRFLSECLPQQVWTADGNGGIDFINNCLQTYLSWEIEDLSQPTWESGGYNWLKYIHSDDFPVVKAAWNLALLNGDQLTTECRILRRDGIYRWHLNSAIPFKSGGKIVKWLGTNTDIEDIKQLELRKDEFISIASHELKTPITSLKGYMQLLEDNIAAPKAGLYVKRGLSQIYRLETLISDLLDVSKMSAERITYNRSSFNFDELLEETIGDLRLTGYTHELRLQQNTAAMVYADRTRLEQVLVNFITNAMKYSPDADKVIVESIVKNNTLTVSIQDFGIGIHDSHRNRIFERFYRVDNTAVFFAGLGLGLYLSSKIISGHQGKYGYVSSQGTGSTFYFSIPLTTAKD